MKRQKKKIKSLEEQTEEWVRIRNRYIVELAQLTKGEREIPDIVSLIVWRKIIDDEQWTVKKAERMASGVPPEEPLPPTREMLDIEKEIRLLRDFIFSNEKTSASLMRRLEIEDKKKKVLSLEKTWGVLRARGESPDIRRQSAGIPGIALLLRKDNALWKQWWLRDFPRFENDLRLRHRNVPQWILDQKPRSNLSVSDRGVEDQYAKVPWRRFYAWCKFFERRCAKYILTSAEERALNYEIPESVQNSLPLGVIIPEPRVADGWHFRTNAEDEQKVYSVELGWRDDDNNAFTRVTLETLAFQAYHTAEEGIHGSPWLAWKTLQVTHLYDTPDPLTYNQVIAVFSRPVLQGGHTYNFLYTSPIRAYGNIVTSFVLWYAYTTMEPLSEPEYRQAYPDGETPYATYEDYKTSREKWMATYNARIATGANIRRPDPNLDQLLVTDMYKENKWTIYQLPFVPTRGKGLQNTTDYGVRFIGPEMCHVCETNEPLFQCKECKEAAFCSHECARGHKGECAGK